MHLMHAISRLSILLLNVFGQIATFWEIIIKKYCCLLRSVSLTLAVLS